LTNKHLWRSSGYINGEWISTSSVGGQFDVTNPANGGVIATLPRMGTLEAEAAAKASSEAWRSWKMTTAKERSAVLMRMYGLMDKYKEDLSLLLMLEAGKPINEARGEIAYAASFYELYAQEATRVNGEILQTPVKGRRLLTMRQPVGPAALVTPWNFPSAMITRKLGPALAAGCTVVIKPAEQTPLSALALCAIAEEAGVPPGVVNCLTVAREDVVQVGTSLCHNPLLRKLSFTGSTAVGKWLMRECASTVKRLSLELGGNAPFIVFDDADLDVAVNALLMSKFRNAGQTCISSNRIFVQEGIYDKFASILTAKVSAMKCGDGLDKSTTMGPLIDERGLSKVTAQVKDCLAKGAKALVGGSPNKLLNDAGGSFYNPTVLSGVTADMAPFWEETFGPVAPLFAFKTEAEVIDMANNTPFGLAGYACTKDLARAFRVSEALECGLVGINEGAISSDLVPFGGMKESGLGREGGHYGIEEYLEIKFVCMGLGTSKL